MLESPPVKTILIKLVIGLLLAAAIAFTARWIYFSQASSPPTVAFDGAHAISVLNTSCVSLQHEYERLSNLPAKEKFDQMYYSPRRFFPCVGPAKDLNVNIENQLLTAFAGNPACEGIRFFQGYYDPQDHKAAQQNKDFQAAEWRLSLDLVASSETGTVSLERSQWTLSPTSLSGSLLSMHKAASDICSVVKNGK